MHGASSDSLHGLTDALQGAVEGGADAARIADDLFGVADVLRREPGLRRVATDVSVAGEAKADLVRRIFGAQLDPASLDLVADAVTRRWTATRDLADAWEQIGVIAIVRGAERSGDADALESELFAFDRAVVDSPELRDALADPARSVADKQALVTRLLEGRATWATVRLARQSVAGSFRTVGLALEAYQKVAADHRDRLIATVRVARELDDRNAERLQDALTRQYSRPVHLNFVVDPRVVGGMRVSIGDDVIDGTVVSRLDEARRRLAG